ncbi:MAG TPA: hypothetical protein VG890_10430 [Puia sp.]|nr:hypothetical protein [Puia sp.]
MKSNQKAVKSQPVTRKAEPAQLIPLTAIGRKLIEIKKISGSGEMTEINLALFRHLK